MNWLKRSHVKRKNFQDQNGEVKEYQKIEKPAFLNSGTVEYSIHLAQLRSASHSRWNRELVNVVSSHVKGGSAPPGIYIGYSTVLVTINFAEGVRYLKVEGFHSKSWLKHSKFQWLYTKWCVKVFFTYYECPHFKAGCRRTTKKHWKSLQRSWSVLKASYKVFSVKFIDDHRKLNWRIKTRYFWKAN